MSTIWITVIVFSLAAEIVVSCIHKRKQTKAANQLTDYLAAGDSDSFDKLIEDKKTQNLIPVFNRLFLKLNRYMLSQDQKNFEEILHQLSTRKLKEGQKRAVALKAFTFYADQGCRGQAEIWLNRIKEYGTTKEKLFADRVFSLQILGSADCLESLLEEIESVPPEFKPGCHLLIARAYRNLNDADNERKHLELAGFS